MKGNQLTAAVLRLLHSLWSDIRFNYDHLTPRERNCLSREEHAELVLLIKEAGLPTVYNVETGELENK